MKKFILSVAAVTGISLLAVSGAEAANYGPGWGAGNSYNHNHNHGSNNNLWGWNNRPAFNNVHNHSHYNPPRVGYSPVPVVRTPVVPVTRPYLGAGCNTPVYNTYPVYNTVPSFGLTTPGFSLYAR
ncbi:hypothetical protein [Planctomicrobium sp. SH664]|uniref:hypothetical protein n=1 Tax=Planctomicrobium sp. SH664 TaxID=3448125 RepID=UPI003F5B0D6D